MAEQRVRRASRGARRRAGGAVGETLKRTGSAASGATKAVSGVTGTDALERVGDQVEETTGGAGRAAERAGGDEQSGDQQQSMGQELREIIREAALEVLAPVARRATTEAAKFALRRGPELARDTIAPKLADTLGPAIEDAGGPGAFAKGALSSVSGARAGLLEKVGLGGDRGDDAKSLPWRERRLPVGESIDVVVPLETAYDRFTQFDEYAKFLTDGETVDERRGERITWKGPDEGTTAVITFHRLSDRLTRVMVTYDHQPQGLLEKTTSVFGGSRRGLTGDLKRFKAFVEIPEEDTDSPGQEAEQQREEPRARGRRRRSSETGGEQPRARARRRRVAEPEEEDEYAEEGERDDAEEPEGEYEEEPEAIEEDEPEGEYEEEEEEEEPAPPRRAARRRPAASPRQPKARRR